MNFYEMLSQHYDVIFPRGEKQSEFIDSYLGEKDKILDIGAGLGSYADYFSKKGHIVTAIDLDETMVHGMEHKFEKGLVDFKIKQLDMLDIDQLAPETYNLAFCIGNTLAHLPNFDLANDFFEKAYNVLDDDGILIVQLVNYDRVLEEKVTELPVIKREDHGLEFIRKYDFVSDKEVMFKGELHIKTDKVNDVYEAETELLALTCETTRDSALNSGFKDVTIYGDFKKAEYTVKSPAIVLVARK